MSHDGEDEDDVADYDPTPKTPRPGYKWHVWRELMRREYGRRTAASSFDAFRVDCYGSMRMVERLELMYKMKGHEGCVNALHFNSTGTRLASGSDDLCVVVWDWTIGEQVLKFDSGHRSNVFQAKFMPMSGDCYIVSCARDGLVRLAELSTTGICKTTRRLAQHKAAAHKLAIEPDSPHHILSCGEDAYVFGIDLRESTPNKLVLVKEKDKKVPLYTIFINPGNTNEFAVGGRDHFVRVYDRRFTSNGTSTLKKYCPHHLQGSDIRASVSCVVYNYDGTEILSSYNDEDIYIFDSAHSDGADYVHRYKGHRNSQTVKGVNYFGLRSEYVVSGSDCGYIYVWDKETEHIVHYMHGDEEGVVNCLEPHPNCPILATSGLDEDVKIWVPSCETPPDMTGLKKKICQNMKEREDERKREGRDTIDSQMLWYLMQQLHRSARRRAHRDGAEANTSSDSDGNSDDEDDGDDMDTQHSVQCVQS
uniref:Putative wd40 repeat protein n=2 Tax=Ornithodoros turicata TaxID=34597 RepID=A0A2R5L8J1_9ACAR